MGLRVTITILLLLALSFLGFVRERYLFNFVDRDQPFIQNRITLSREYADKYPESTQFTNPYLNPKWGSTVVYSLIYIALGVLIIQCAFRNRRFTVYTLVIYLLLSFLSGLILSLFYLFGRFPVGYQVFQPIKFLVQSPVLPFILLVSFFLLKKKIED